MQLAHEYKFGAIMDMPIYDASALVKGQPLIWGQEASGTGSLNALVDSSAVPIDIFGVIAETPDNVITNFGTPIIYTAKVQMVNILPVWKVFWDTTGIAVTSSTSTVLTHGSGDDNLDGCWIYIVSGTGAGQLRYVKAAAATTKTVNTAFTTTPDNTSTFLLIRGQGVPTGGQDLTTDLTKLKSAVSATGQLCIIKNWIIGPTGVEDLNITKNSHLELDGLNSRGVRFFSHVCFMDTFFSVDSI